MTYFVPILLLFIFVVIVSIWMGMANYVGEHLGIGNLIRRILGKLN